MKHLNLFEIFADDDNGFISDIDSDTVDNKYFREVLFTTGNIQLVLMSIKPGQEIGSEVHDGEQFIKVENGTGVAVLNDEEHNIFKGFSIIIPSGVEHNIINTGKEDLKVYTIYTPPEHEDDEIVVEKE